MITLVTIKMNLNKEKNIYFDPPLINAKEIQLEKCYTMFSEVFLLFCDIIDSNFSLTNFNGSVKPSKLLTVLANAGSYPSLPIQNKKELSNLTLSIKKQDMSAPTKSDEIYIVLKIYHFQENELHIS